MYQVHTMLFQIEGIWLIYASVQNSHYSDLSAIIRSKGTNLDNTPKQWVDSVNRLKIFPQITITWPSAIFVLSRESCLPVVFLHLVIREKVTINMRSLLFSWNSITICKWTVCERECICTKPFFSNKSYNFGFTFR